MGLVSREKHPAPEVEKDASSRLRGAYHKFDWTELLKY